MRRLTLLSFALIPVLCSCHLAVAQNLERDQLNVSGTLKRVAPGAIEIATGEGDLWVLKVDAKPQDVTFTGTAEKSFLRSGIFVEFRAQVSKRGVVDEPVATLTVFTPSEARPPGVLPDGDLGGAGAGLFSEPQEKKKLDPKEKKAAKLKGDDTVYRVAGAISKIGRAGDLTVSTGGVQVKFNLAEDCKISVDTNDLAFVSPGDKVSAQGWFLKGRPGQGAANKIEVTAAVPLADNSKKKTARPTKESKTGVKGAKGETADKEDKPAEEKKEEKAEKKDGDTETPK